MPRSKPLVLTMGAPPFGAECAHCGRAFKNREPMTAIPFADGEPSGWYCSECADCWRRQDEGCWLRLANEETT